MLEPMQVGQWLGFVIDTIKMQFRVPPKKIAKIKSNLDFMISSGSATFRGLARVAGFINLLYLAVGPIARLFTRWMHATIQAVRSGIVHFLFLRLYRKNCVSGLLISRPLTDMGFNLSLLRVQLSFAMLTIMNLEDIGSN